MAEGTDVGARKMRPASRKRLDCWKIKLLVASITLACASAQEISACCDKASGTCRSVCEKMSLVEKTSSSALREERIHNIYKFCAPSLIEFWICMNQTIQEVVTGSDWWGRACCALGRAAACRLTCATAIDESALIPVCRKSDEIAFLDCVQKQREAQWCCSRTQSLSCNEACQKVLWRVGQSHVDLEARERAFETCEESPPLLLCMKELTASTTHDDTAKYLPCCHESPSPECRRTCESVLSQKREIHDITAALAQACSAPAIHDALSQCFLRTDESMDSRDNNLIPHDAAKLHCCRKATTIECRRLCFNTFNTGRQSHRQKFYNECLGDPREGDLSECLDEVEAPCSLGCNGLTYCSQLNNRPATLFRSCSAHADLDAHLAVAEQRERGFVRISGMELPLRNTSQCTSEIWKNVACALHVKPCTPKGHSSLLCQEDCLRLVAACVELGAAARPTARQLCARLAPQRSNAPCVPLTDLMTPSTTPPALTAREAVTSPCAAAACNNSQLCLVNRNCLHGACAKYTCVDGCPLGEGSAQVVPIGSWARVPMPTQNQTEACYKICRCGPKGLSRCQPLPCVTVDNCTLHDKVILHGEKYYMECNPCACVSGERVCSRRACGRAALLTGLPCNCPPHHLPVHDGGRLFPNACLAKCAGARDAELEFGSRGECASAPCGRLACLPARRGCLSKLQACAQYVCVNTSNCSSQAPSPVCDTDGRTHASPCRLVMSGRRLAYWGECLNGCRPTGRVCGVNGVTYASECAAWAEFVSIDYAGPCLAVGPISDLMEPKCQLDRITCPKLIKPNCLGFTAPGACCPKCGGALRILYSKKQIERALYGTNISASAVNLSNILKALQRHVKIAQCALKGFLTVESELFVTVETMLMEPTDLQLQMCVLEAEKIADLINRESALISSDLGLSALSYALIVHKHPTSGCSVVGISTFVLLASLICSYFFKLLL